MNLRDLMNHGLYALGTLVAAVAVFGLLRGSGAAVQAWRAGDKQKATSLVLSVVQVAVFLAAVLVLMNTQGKGGLLLAWLMVLMPATGVAANLYRLRSSNTNSSNALTSNTPNLEAPQQRPD